MLFRSGSTIGERKQFFRHARWVLLSAIFIKLQLSQGHELQLTSYEAHIVTENAEKFIEELWIEFEKQFGDSSKTTVWLEFIAWPTFFDEKKCDLLRNGLLARLAKT